MKRRKIFGDKMTKSGYSVDCAIPGGNIIIDKIDGDDVFLRQDLRDTAGNWFYWCFRVCGAEGKIISFHFPEDVIGVRGPAISNDKGLTWRWQNRDFTENKFKYAFAPSESEVWFAFGMVYTQRDWERFLATFTDSPFLEPGQLAMTKKSRKVEKLRLGCIKTAPLYRVVLTARHHCGEMMASYVLEGVISGVLSDDVKGKWLRENVEFLLIPFVDKDGVEEGDQGKNRKPHDHNRDYKGDSIYPETRVLREFVMGWARGKLKIAFDLHCPYIRGTDSEKFHMVGSQSDSMWLKECEFSEILESVQAGTIVYSPQDNVAFGQSWNVAANWALGKCFSQWAEEISGVDLSASFEIPYANANGKEVNSQTAREIGHDLAKAIYCYLEKSGHIK